MNWDDDDDGEQPYPLRGPSLFECLTGSVFFGPSAPEPMSNAGRYLAQLKRGDQGADAWFASNKEACEELLCALKRADLKARTPA